MKDIIDEETAKRALLILKRKSWGLFDITASEGGLNINYFNKYILDGYNWFICDGLFKFFENQYVDFNTGNGRLIFSNPELLAPNKSKLSINSAGDPMYPEDARKSGLTYESSMRITYQIINKDKGYVMHTDTVRLCEIPVMLGSAIDNLTELVGGDPEESKRALAEKGECYQDPAGYFIINGQEKVLISQGYQNANQETCFRDKKSGTVLCEINSRGPDWAISQHQIFIMKPEDKKIMKADKRLYMKTPFIVRNVIDKSTTLIGINIMYYWRLAHIYKLKFHPENYGVEPEYSYIDKDNVTYDESSEAFADAIRRHAGEGRFAEIVESYIATTLMEAKKYDGEIKFWKTLVKATTAPGSSKTTKKEEEINITDIQVHTVMDKFISQFMPHCSEKSWPINHLDMIIDYNNTGIEYQLNTDNYNNIVGELDFKLETVAHMVIRLLQVQYGYAAVDDKNLPSSSKVETAGAMIMTRFQSLFSQFKNEIRNSPTPGKSKDNAFSSKIESAGETYIYKPLIKNFSQGEWNSANATKKRTGASDKLPRTVMTATLAALRKISSPTNSKSKHIAPRLVQPGQIGTICLAETPEGKQTGLTKHLALAAYVTVENSTKYVDCNPKSGKEEAGDVTDFMAGISYKLDNSKSKENDTPIMFNGIFYGFGNGLQVRKSIIESRRRGLLHEHTGVSYKQKFTEIGKISVLRVNTSGGRIVQPLIIVKDLKYMTNFIDRLSKNENFTIQDLIDNADIEYVDAAELEFLRLASSLKDYIKSVNEGQEDRYTHIMINPAFMGGVSVNMGPFAAANPVVRNAYTTNHLKQMAATPLPTYKQRNSKDITILHHPQRPLVEPAIYRKVLDRQQFGSHLHVIFKTDKRNQEDAIVIREGALELLGSTAFSVFTMDMDSQELGFEDDFMQRVNNPNRYGRGIIRTHEEVVVREPLELDEEDVQHIAELTNEYDSLEENDPQREDIVERIKFIRENVQHRNIIVRKPVKVGAQDILATKKTYVSNIGVYEHLRHDKLRDGFINGIYLSKGSIKSRRLSISVQYDNSKLDVGDKLANRFAQKGIIASIIPDDEMPYDSKTGKKADLIINPQGLPSRMTVGMPIEMLTNNAMVLPDLKKVVSVLYNERGIDIYIPLVRLFLVDALGWWRRSKPEIEKDEFFIRDKARSRPNPESITIVYSFNVRKQEDMNWLIENDQSTGSEYGKEIWVIALDMSNKIYLATDGKGEMDNFFEPYDLEVADVFPNKFIEEIQGAWFDSNKEIPEKGVKMSNLNPDIVNSYIEDFPMRPVPTQYIAGYKPDFFMSDNLWYNFGLDFEMSEYITFSKFLTAKLENGTLVSETNPLVNTLIPPDEVVALPENARTLFERRTEIMTEMAEASMFKEFDVKAVMRELGYMGYSQDGTSEFINGKTGRPIEGVIFNGFSYYMSLNHLVRNKMQARGRGSLDMSTRQPVRGRTRRGGIKFNKADARNVFVTGAVHVLHDRILDSSDKQKAIFCAKCGHLCYVKDSNVICPVCANKSEPTSIEIPWNTIKTFYILAGAGIKASLKPASDTY